MVKNTSAKCKRYKRRGFDPWVRKIPWRRVGNPFQYSWLENPTDRGAWQVMVYRVTKSQTQLKLLSRHVQNLPSGSKGVGSYQALRSWGTAVQAFHTHRFRTHGYNQMRIESI